MIILNFFLAFIVVALSIMICGAPLAAFFDTPSIIVVGASVLLFLIGSGHVGLFFNGLRKSFSFQREENAAMSESFAKLSWFTPMAGVFWAVVGIMIMLGDLDPETVGVGIAVTLLTMFYAVFVTLFLFWPIAVRFRPALNVSASRKIPPSAG